MASTGTGAVVPGAPVASLPTGKLTIIIEAAHGENDGLLDTQGKPAVSENVMAKCVYPDGFIKNHQTNSPQDLAEKVINQLRNRYAATEVKVIKLPAAIKPGATIEMEV